MEIFSVYINCNNLSGIQLFPFPFSEHFQITRQNLVPAIVYHPPLPRKFLFRLPDLLKLLFIVNRRMKRRLPWRFLEAAIRYIAPGLVCTGQRYYALQGTGQSRFIVSCSVRKYINPRAGQLVLFD